MALPSIRTEAALARTAANRLAAAPRAAKDTALIAMAQALRQAQTTILQANAADVARAESSGVADSLIDRLRLTPDRVSGMAAGLIDLAGLPDPVGDVVRGWTLANGVDVRQVRVPLGVIGIIYEARPNVTADAAGICLKSGNAALLRGSSSASDSNRAIVDALRAGLMTSGFDPHAVTLLEGGHDLTAAMMAARGLIDVLIPRGGANLIQTVVTGSQVPVIETGTGNCHLFVDADADLDMATTIILNAKTQRPAVCNALETILVHADLAQWTPRLIDTLDAAGVSVHGDPAVRQLDPRAIAVPDDDWDHEALALTVRLAMVADVDEAIEFIRAHTSGHSETIITNDLTASTRFTSLIDAACVLVNASSRFVDGGEFGFGAEIGISTQKLHARGPMGLAEMTCTKYVLVGQGQVR
ncbi:MAG: glutamate-5-semialdehyde dehydrogenase [Propionibacteriaceae bacterium]|jgi:glutamate-5-semialdehyde dehydrogenase|nr:glutamate-5-semialdehyde dehydrogenase [Propionibacteriaceae bacterium]